MTISKREAALAAFFDLFAGLDQFPIKARNPNWRLDGDVELPALVQLDGGAVPVQEGSDQEALRVGVHAGVKTTSSDDLGPALSEARAAVMGAVHDAMVADATLGGKIDWIRWDGDDDPDQDIREGAPSQAVIGVNFSLLLTERDLYPLLLT